MSFSVTKQEKNEVKQNSTTHQLRKKRRLSFSTVGFAFVLFLSYTSSIVSGYIADTSKSHRIRKGGDERYRPIRVLNLSPSKVEISWMNLYTEERIVQHDILLPGAHTVLHSYLSHEFEVKELPKNTETKECNGKKGYCRTRYFQVNEKEDQLITITEDFKIIHTDSRSRAIEEARKAVQECRLSSNSSRRKEEKEDTLLDTINDFTSCMSNNLIERLMESQSEIELQSSIRDRMGYSLANYACHDHANFPQTQHIYKSVYSYRWNNNTYTATPKTITNNTDTNNNSNVDNSNGNGDEDDSTDEFIIKNSFSNHQMRLMFKDSASKILLIDDFITINQCNTIKKLSTTIAPSLSEQERIEAINNDGNEEAKHVVVWDSIYKSTNLRYVAYKMYQLIRIGLNWDDSSLPKQEELQKKNDKHLFELYYDDDTDDNDNDSKTITKMRKLKSASTSISNIMLTTNNDDVMILDDDYVTEEDGDNNNDDVDNENISYGDAEKYSSSRSSSSVLAAKFLFFCDVPEVGGEIHFPKTGIHILPEQGQAILISYNDPTAEASSSQKQHRRRYYTNECISCPIHSGNRTIITHDVFLH